MTETIEKVRQSKVLITGATGFVGAALMKRLRGRGAVRSTVPPGNCEYVLVGDINKSTDWSDALVGIDSIVHLAARVHLMHDIEVDPLAAFRRVNVQGTENLARQAATAGVRRFVFVSSVKVNGESTVPGRPFRADDPPQPADPYGISKHEAELALAGLSRATGMELVVIRPTLVYGPGVGANFRSMMSWVRRGIPLPFGAIDNRRSLVALDNLCDLIALCTHHPAAAGRTFLASDGEDVSTTELLRRLGQALGRPARLLPVRPGVLEAAFGLLGKRQVAQRLCSSLQVDIQSTRDQLGWRPLITLDDGLRRAALSFIANSAPAPGSTSTEARG